MTLDAIALHAVKDEIAAAVLGGRVEKVALIGTLSLGLLVYARGRKSLLIASADPSASYVCLLDQPLSQSTENITPFLLLLRKYVRDGRVVDIRQPRLERLLEIRVAKSLEGHRHEVSLIIEVMGRRSNIVLVDSDSSILDAIRRASPDRNPSRPIMPHVRYQPPPPQDRLDPMNPADLALLRDVAMQGAGPSGLADLLAARLAGFGPLAACEVAFRATGNTDTPAAKADWSAVRSAIDELLAPLDGRGAWEPCLVRDTDGQVVAFAPYWLHHWGHLSVERASSISAAVAQAYNRSPRDTAPTHKRAVGPLLAVVAEEMRRLQRKLLSLERSLGSASRVDDLRLAGETVLACASEIMPGQQQVEFGGRVIDLDPELSPIENAQRYFEEYRKARDAARVVPGLIEQAKADLQYLEQAKALLESLEDPASIQAIRRELEEAGLIPNPKPARKGHKARHSPSSDAAPSPLRFTTSDGLTVLVGTSGRGNERVTFSLAGPDDIWLHARGVPGAHVVLKVDGRPPPRSSLLEAARLAARFSAAKETSRVLVDWTQRKHVRKLRGGRPGLVIYSGEQTVRVAPS